MVTPAQLSTWQPDRLGQIADDVARHRGVLTRLDDDVADARPPLSWTFADASAARAEHSRLSQGLATQVSETVGVIEALDAAATAIRRAQTSLEGAIRRAGGHGLRVDQSTGAVTSTRTYDDEEDADYARGVMNEIAEQVSAALGDADAADQALAAVLRAAATTDVNAIGSLGDQRRVLEFQELSQADQVRHLLDHPEDFALLGAHTSPEVKALVGQEVAEQLDGAARDATAFGDAAAVERYTRLLDAFGDDPDVMGPMYQRLGPDGLLATYNGMTSMMYVGANVEELGDLAGRLRDGLQTATRQDGFDGRAFGEDLVRYATHTTTDAERDAFSAAYPSQGEHAAVLDYLLRDGDYGEDFVRGVAWELDAFERSNPLRAETWTHHASFASPLNGLGVDGDGIHQADPMAAAMGQLGRHPGLGLEFFSDADGAERTGYYFAERDWSRDGFAGISEAALAIGTDADNLAGDPEKTGLFVSEFFGRLPDNPQFTAEHAAGASEPLGALLKHYMPSVQIAVGTPTSANGAAGLVTIQDDFLPALDNQPKIYSKDLDVLLGVALSTEEGMARVAEGVANYRQTAIGGWSVLHGAGVEGATYQALEDVLTSSAGLEGHMQEALSMIDIEGARSRDQQIAAFTGLVSKAASLVPVPGAEMIVDVAGSTGKQLADAAWSEIRKIPSGQITEIFGGNEDAARAEATDTYLDSRARSVVSSFLALAEAGVVEVPATMRDTWMPGGRLLSVSDIPLDDLGVRTHEASTLLRPIVSVETIEGAFTDPYRVISTEGTP
ncbi:hypothetical protein CHO01_38450 [Cellulomonas hominis]|uniref:Uncharacterized protein n=1 Tax=Cellulomonas hominis TaxID=156981 RepID=A0A511FHJ0_9CELL|nr:hypothetical protein [Cellulomonas hominis]MBB5472345.1 hypothetical protein [Cellulomonas hominis]NKY07651.1 hypothetical protein [Cellulomonas hominis]GEL48729.1 hypothetical protein CHO01_38450 [Cellulomonas hominis]